jgi:hypothetical protein
MTISDVSIPEGNFDRDSDADHSSLIARLKTFYEEHNPDQLSKLDKILEVYKGRELCIFPDLDKKYNTKHSTEEELAAAVRFQSS